MIQNNFTAVLNLQLTNCYYNDSKLVSLWKLPFQNTCAMGCIMYNNELFTG